MYIYTTTIVIAQGSNTDPKAIMSINALNFIVSRSALQTLDSESSSYINWKNGAESRVELSKGLLQ